jgi:hypothetical protein
MRGMWPGAWFLYLLSEALVLLLVIRRLQGV